MEVKTLTDIISCLCYNTDFYYRWIWKISVLWWWCIIQNLKISVLWWWCIIQNFTLYINHFHSCCKSLLPPFPIMNYIPYMYLVFDLWKGWKCKYLKCTPWLIMITEAGWVVSANLPTRSVGCMKFHFPAHPYHSSSGLSRPKYGSLQFTSREMSKFYCWKHLALSTHVFHSLDQFKGFFISPPPLSLSCFLFL